MRIGDTVRVTVEGTVTDYIENIIEVEYNVGYHPNDRAWFNESNCEIIIPEPPVGSIAVGRTEVGHLWSCKRLPIESPKHWLTGSVYYTWDEIRDNVVQVVEP